MCGKEAALAPSYPCGDSTCPTCGQLLWWFRGRLARLSDPDVGQAVFDSALLANLDSDSLDLVELFLEVQQEFGVAIPDDIRTVQDAIRYIIDHRDEAA